MDTWETVVSGSTLASGDFWEHLNAQGGGEGPGGTTFIEAFDVQQDEDMLELHLEDQADSVHDDTEGTVVYELQEDLIIEENDD